MFYFESHITVSPVFGGELEEFRNICSQYKFKVAKLLLKKTETDLGVESDLDSFATGHGTDLHELARRMEVLLDLLVLRGFNVIRYKIEDIIIDSRHDDYLKLIK